MLKYKKVKTLMHEKNISKKDATDALRRNKWDLEATRKEYNIPEILDAIIEVNQAFVDMMNEVAEGMKKTIETLIDFFGEGGT
jgi:hypothetical protein